MKKVVGGIEGLIATVHRTVAIDGLMIIKDTIYGDSLTNAPLLRNLHPKMLGCTLARIFAPSTDKVYPRSTNDPWGNSSINWNLFYGVMCLINLF